MGERSLSSVFVPQLNSTCSYRILSLSICLIKSFMRLHCVELEVSYVCSSEEKLNHVLKTDGDKLFKYLLTNKIFSKQILS